MRRRPRRRPGVRSRSGRRRCGRLSMHACVADAMKDMFIFGGRGMEVLDCAVGACVLGRRTSDATRCGMTDTLGTSGVYQWRWDEPPRFDVGGAMAVLHGSLRDGCVWHSMALGHTCRYYFLLLSTRRLARFTDSLLCHLEVSKIDAGEEGRTGMSAGAIGAALKGALRTTCYFHSALWHPCRGRRRRREKF